ncbi:AAA domain (dynein-related subfamily) [Desulfonispora thiosulfatigenes DSM 11270]|uniref:AAA domain (Dynein-related subfamily) n=1 Tax=Desulfonispora thiosulfatigenes DSM 11270 TaxID=656914 RepID=A0A1W1UK65_DESTI|nr:AAA family ATPase [Desulfonispora thiosulfatigenes]SMB81429.1 AAA domain (dynein-related subfamily) [Desulfonispora thiosulfatigenes DSM 11270]
MKKEFLEYIGPIGVLERNKYQKSYKLLLLLGMLYNLDEHGRANYSDVLKWIQNFFLERKENGFILEDKSSVLSKNNQSLDINKLKSMINDNAYSVISSKGYIEKTITGESEFVQFPSKLWQEINNQEDLQKIKDILQDKLKRYFEMLEKENIDVEAEVDETQDETEAIISNIHAYIKGKGYFYTYEDIANFYLSLKTKPFVLLAGLSGTGKSKLVKLFAEAIGANTSNRRFSLIPVRPDWSDPSDLLGYKNIDGKYNPGPVIKVIKEATENLNYPYFLCLDEMNLARVEYYFSDMLSVMETREQKDTIVTNQLLSEDVFGEDSEAKDKYKELYLPENLYIIGTVNMDETTYSFSKKVLDRANTIEFSCVDLEFNFDDVAEDEEKEEIIITNKSLKSEYLILKDCLDERNIAEKAIDHLINLNKILAERNMQFGYRVRDEIVFYVIYSVKENIFKFNKALDFSILQKILPKIQGNDIEIKKILVNLFSYVTDQTLEYDLYSNEIADKMYAYLAKNTEVVLFKKSAYKICDMTRRLESDGFTTFW